MERRPFGFPFDCAPWAQAQGFGLFRASLPATAKSAAADKQVNSDLRQASPEYFYAVRSCLPASRVHLTRIPARLSASKLFSFLLLFSVLD